MGPFNPREAKDLGVSRGDANKAVRLRSAHCCTCIADVENRNSDMSKPGVFCIQNNHKVDRRFKGNAAVNYLSSSG